MLKISCLVENTVVSKNFKGEHGLSFFTETDRGNIIFDCGQTDMFTENAKISGIDPGTAETIILSHGHYDHTGGLPALKEVCGEAQIYAHPYIFTERFTPAKTADSGARPIGITFEMGFVEKHFKLNLSEKPLQIFQDVYFVGEIPRKNYFENTGGDFYMDKKMSIKDNIPDDTCLLIRTDIGATLVLGCCHSGIINTLDYIREKFGIEKYALIAGGMHLLNASDNRMEKTIVQLKNYCIEMLCPGHCTGWKAVCRLSAAFPGKVSPLYSGWIWTR